MSNIADYKVWIHRIGYALHGAHGTIRHAEITLKYKKCLHDVDLPR
jgi:hypothetical protein